MKVVHVSAECFPYAKVGGLADVVGSLPHYQSLLGIESDVVMPLYDLGKIKRSQLKTVFSSNSVLGEEVIPFSISIKKEAGKGGQHYFVDIPSLLYTPFVYSQDDARRFLAFQIAVLTWFIEGQVGPDIVHCHDHHTGLIPFMMNQSRKFQSLKGKPTLLTIHNAQYQGWMDYAHMKSIPSFDLANRGLLDWNDTINSLAAGIKCAWRVTTVSNSYMAEMMEHANGLEDLLSSERQKCIGILNGIDTDVWNTETDADLVKNYKVTSAQSGKNANKVWLCDKFGLDAKKPLMVFIGRLVYEKGADLFAEIFEQSLNSIPMSILLLGSGNTDIEDDLKALKAKFKGRFNAHIGYDESLAHKMYAGADYLFMPSRVEPCGLNQMYAMRYGTLPIVSRVGGLKDTVQDISQNGSGICIDSVSSKDALRGIKRAAEFYKDQVKFKKTRQSIMKLDYSWDESAKQYIDLYETL